jgi:two-component system response regulator HydG
MADELVLALLELSDAFHRIWGDVASELGMTLERVHLGEEIPAAAVAVLVAAGGEESSAVDVVSSIAHSTSVPVYVVGAQPSHRFAVETVRGGGSDYFVLPDDLDLLRRTLTATVERGRERRDRVPSAGADPFASLHGASGALQRVLDDARRVVRHRDVTVLIQGETGTGKELLARALHDGSPRAAGPFVALNCAAIPRELLESELFGHERGAFTHAHAAKPGLFEEADGGTLFLDEIGHLPLDLQGKLLRTLDDRQIRRVGSTRSLTVDVRIIAATHVDLASAAHDGRFRRDLFYRLNVVTLTLPPLRDRGDDVERLAGHFVARLSERYGLTPPTIDASVRTVMRAHPWPGNVRELQHAIERALLLSEPGTLDPAHLTPAPGSVPTGAGPIPFPATLDEIEEAAARAAVEQQDGNKSAAARQLGISRARLQRLLGPESE